MTAPRDARRRDAGVDGAAKIRGATTTTTTTPSADYGGKEGCCCTDSGERSCGQTFDRSNTLHS